MERTIEWHNFKKIKQCRKRINKSTSTLHLSATSGKMRSGQNGYSISWSIINFPLMYGKRILLQERKVVLVKLHLPAQCLVEE